MGRKHKKHKAEKEPEDEKPGLKLVLKFGASEAVEPAPSAEESDHHRHHKHKKKKKKKSSDRDRERHRDKYESSSTKRKLEEEEEDQVVEEEVADGATDDGIKEEAITSELDEQPMDSTMEDDAASVEADEDAKVQPEMEEEGTSRKKGSPALQKLLLYLHKMLQKKDLQDIFAFPVTDNIAPMYSQIISHPMDFSTMLSKVEDNVYQTVAEFRNDFQVMCTNCMTYNRPDTIYYKAAKKLLSSGLRQMSKEQMLKLKATLPFGEEISNIDLDLAPEESINIEAVEETSANEIVKQLTGKTNDELEPVGDHMTPEEILEQARAAAKGAADKLTMRQPNSKMGFLRRREDGTTTLNILNPENTGIVNEKERVVNLGKLLGKPQGGTGAIPGFKEDKRNAAKPVNYLYYGPFSSYAPIYDSSFATIPKEESDLLLSTYGDETGVQYAKSVQHFVEDSGEFAVKMVDRLLDIITAGEHSKTMQVLHKQEEALKLVEQSGTEAMYPANQPVTEPAPTASTSDQAAPAEHVKSEGEKDSIQQKLDETADLLQELQETQYERLSGRPPAHLGQVQGPSYKETQLAEKVTVELTNLTKQVQPGQVVPSEGVRVALGIDSEDISDVIMDDDAT